MKYILDSSYFFGDYNLDGEFFTTPEVVGELKDLASKMRYEILAEKGLVVTEPEAEHLFAATNAALKSGDARVLSDTDISVIALGLTLEGTVVTDDFAVQNVCRHLKIPFRSIMQRRAKKAGLETDLFRVRRRDPAWTARLSGVRFGPYPKRDRKRKTAQMNRRFIRHETFVKRS